jgi:hypothetical protein
MKHENYIQPLVEDDNVQQIKLSFKANDQLLNLLNKVNSFGKIIIESKLSDVDIEAYAQNQAQQRVVNIPVRSGNDVMLKIKQRIKTYRSNVEVCCILSNGKMVFTIISPAEVIVLHKDGSRDFTINIRSGISNHCRQRAPVEIVLSSSGTSQLDMFDIQATTKSKYYDHIVLLYLESRRCHYRSIIFVCFYLYVSVVNLIDYSDIDKMMDINNEKC